MTAHAFPLMTPPAGRIARGSLAKTLPRMAAVRVPSAVHHPVPFAFPAARPQIFVHEGARQALERKLRAAFPGPVVLAVTDNRHSMISFAKRGGVLRARIHMMFLDAPAPVRDALVRYMVRNDREASMVVGRYIDDNGHRIRAVRPVLTALSTKGQHHDLLALASNVSAKYFGGTVDALITWGRGSPKRARTTIKLGSYSAIERLIRIHPNLDRAWVPRYFVQYIVFHEMLHHVIPASRGAGRKLLHPPEFRAREAQFRHFERAMAWERAHIGRLLRT